MKRAVAFLSAVAAILACIPLFGCIQHTHIVITSREIGDFYCSVYEDQTLEIIKYMGDDEIVAIPAKMGEYEIVGISTRAFYNRAKVKEVYLPSTIKELPAKLFDGCPDLEAIYIPATVTKIGKNLVSDCPSFDLVRYAGTEKQWNNIPKGTALTENYAITAAEKVYEFVVGD